MSLFDKFLKKKSEDKEQEIQIPDDWDFYLCDIDGKTGSYFLNLALINIIPIVEKNAFLWIELTLNQPTEDGMSSQQEYDTLISLEDQLIPQITELFNAIYVGRLTHSGTRDFYFYLNENIYDAKLVEKTIHKFSDYQIKFGLKNDPLWDIYRETIYPNIYAMQSLTNDRVIRNLENHGDTLVAERPVEHWCYFETSEGRDKFIKTIQTEGFEINSQSYHEENKKPYCVQLVRTDSVELDNINGVTWALLELCIENGGEYDGWETLVILN
ncbi:DUF695 domain-containing protein [Acinetobacter sp. WCHAc060033]|uniref:DUF695 domain-containing protein n=1 Tax=Acinetobacter sp. WCHAc060033 TaxID=2518624 RepID=UPI0013EEA44B|nr:DUF695 domain-containing protein [Acinetobacter sp. WCHAc060033]